MKRLAFVSGAVLAGVLVFAAPAAAHVTINPEAATQGDYARLAFRVPNESDTASTVKLEVTLPEDAPVASVSVMPVAGWTTAVERRTVSPPIESHGTQISEVVSKITWTAAAGGGVKPGEFVEFPVSAGPLPEVDQMVFKALQTYSDGDISRWIEAPTGGAEPEDPAPVLALAAASATASPSPAAAASDADSTDAGVWLGLIGLITGAGGLVLGGLAFARTRRPTSS
ncbi:YcnI family protein [Actinomycetes bacterium KLBMP 9797]